jgi:hypothetical protein
MAKGEHLKALLKSLTEGDDDRLYSVALQMAADEARAGHTRLARELRILIEGIRSKHSLVRPANPLVPLDQPRGELSGVLSVAYPDTHIQDLILPPDLLARLRLLILEQRQQGILEAHDLRPRFRVLLVGPPGSGKTLTARAIAGELKLPLFTILLDGLITKFMGETAAKLRLVFDAIGRRRGVYLFDEFDAIGGQRALLNDVGEIRRVLNSFLYFLEEALPTSVIVAATNHPDLLDPALFRRFDDVLEYGFPTPEQVLTAFESCLSRLSSTNVDWDVVLRASEDLSLADVLKACEDAAKKALLAGERPVGTEDLVESIVHRRTATLRGRPRRG